MSFPDAWIDDVQYMDMVGRGVLIPDTPVTCNRLLETLVYADVLVPTLRLLDLVVDMGVLGLACRRTAHVYSLELLGVWLRVLKTRINIMLLGHLVCVGMFVPHSPRCGSLRSLGLGDRKDGLPVP